MIIPNTLRALVVDDNAYARAICEASLGKLGIGTIETADGGAQAIIKLMQTPYDFIVTDWYMPEVSGAGLMRILREPAFGAAHTTPVIVMTAYANPDNVALARALGVNEILSKPFTTDELGAAMMKVLRHAAIRFETGEEDSVFI